MESGERRRAGGMYGGVHHIGFSRRAGNARESNNMNAKCRAPKGQSDNIGETPTGEVDEAYRSIWENAFLR